MESGQKRDWEFHRPVLVSEFLELMSPGPGMIICDGTIGGGGLAEAIMERVEGQARLIGIDRDADALAFASRRLSRFGSAITLIQGKFSELGRHLEQAGVSKADRIYFDLGVSSYQLDNAERGFSFRLDGPLDMRFDQSSGEPVSQVLQRMSEKELERIFREYGEERFSRRVAREIVRRRKRGLKLERTLELSGLIEEVVPRRGQRVHPATRIFQALRMYVNQELEELREGLKQSLEWLSSGGRVGVFSYESLSDREVKNFFRAREKAGELGIITRKPVVPSMEEMLCNPRSRSAKLRVAERN